MRTILLLLTAVTVAVAAPTNVVTPEPNAHFRSLVKAADRIIVTTAGLHPSDLKNQKLLLDIEGASEVSRIAGFFQFTGEYANASLTKWEGEEALAVMNCLCTGTHMISFVREGKEVLAMSLHHWTHVRPSRGWKSHDINLTKESSALVRAFLSGPERKTANQAPEPTPGSVTPRATESKSK